MTDGRAWEDGVLRRLEPADDPALADIHSVAFGIPDPADPPRWWETAGRENVRVWAPRDRVLGGLVDIPMGLFVGGRSVSLHGVAGVAIAPEARGSGAGTAMMAGYLQELAKAGVACSALYASTRALYRRVGYDLAGERWIGEAPLDALRGVGRRDGRWLPVGDEDWARIEQAYARFAPMRTGRMDRGPYLWGRVRAHRGTPNRGWWLPGPDGPAAWVVIRQTPGSGNDTFGEVELVDHHADGPIALQQLVGFLSTFGAMARALKIAGPTPIWDLLPEHRVALRLQEPWLLRIVDVRRALEGRGWPPGLTATLSLQIEDTVVRDNHGRFTVRVRDGGANVQAGGDGTLRVSIHGLASLYTGYADPWTLVQRGELTGPPEALPALGAAFAGPRPLLGDFF